MSRGRTPLEVGSQRLRLLAARLRHRVWMRRRKRGEWPEPDGQAQSAGLRLPPPPPEDLERLRQVAEAWERGLLAHLGLPRGSPDWRAWNGPMLWDSERHHHVELVALAAMALEEPQGRWLLAARALAETWAAREPPEAGPAWEPAATARRILSWSEAAALKPELGASLAPRLAVQLEHLLRHLEPHEGGSRLLCEAAALLAGGSVLEGPAAKRARQEGGELLERELAAQVLGDGGHVERNAWTQAQVLRDGLLALQLARLRGRPPALDGPLTLLASWLAAVRRADGSFPWINDAAPHAASTALDALRRAARQKLLAPPAPGTALELPDTGWTVVRDGGCELLFDHGPAGPRGLPDGSHADALAYELLWHNLAVVTDSGMSEFEGPVRSFERSAAAHATISVDGEGVDELRAARRIGRRGTVQRLSAPPGDERVHALRGRARSFRGWTHERWLFLWPGRGLVVFDRVSGTRPGARVLSHLPLDPAWSAAAQGQVVFLLGPNARGLQVHLVRGELEGLARGEEGPRDGWVAAGIGRAVPRTSLRLRADAEGVCVYGLLAPSAGFRQTAAGLVVRAPGAEVLLRTDAGLPR